MCDQGYYGSSCSETCGHCVNGSTTCHNVTGRCPDGCSSGWRDDTCKRACEYGYYGDKCNSSCGHCLNGNTACNKVTGHCHDGCGAGWKEDTCKIECSNGTHGKNCEQTCNNCKESNCDRFNGACFDGCIAGFANPDTGCVEKFVADDNTVGVAAGGAAAAIAVIVVVIIAVVFWKRRHKKESSVKEDFTDLKCTSPPPHKDVFDGGKVLAHWWSWHSIDIVLLDVSIGDSCTVSTGIVVLKHKTSTHTPSKRGIKGSPQDDRVRFGVAMLKDQALIITCNEGHKFLGQHLVALRSSVEVATDDKKSRTSIPTESTPKKYTSTSNGVLPTVEVDVDEIGSTWVQHMGAVRGGEQFGDDFGSFARIPDI
ncbi:multiple epidermal growth factor-like domains protein 10 [Gigantopelta aegis]|uniref:multiple epidermal growth factor-like domains protein 10 n=1 Tax=Gigantopelta aegis TaxID=1735272 RepID=UPI001B888655|nr:multiple epidermal growth factor-like domains protein 10 [Gigantopelta aegis]